MVQGLGCWVDRVLVVQPGRRHLLRDPHSLEKVPVLDLFPEHLCQQRAQRTYQTRMFFELFADTGANERGPDLEASLPNTGSGEGPLYQISIK